MIFTITFFLDFILGTRIHFYEVSIVNILHVSVDGLWTSWGPWGSCSVSCGDGLQIRERNCSEPAPKFGGRECLGFINETQSCYSGTPCPSKLTTIYGVSFYSWFVNGTIKAIV